jgi:hypothetical protein
MEHLESTRKAWLASVLLPVCLAGSGWAMDRVEILVGSADIARLEADPYFADKVPATFVSAGDTFQAVVSYRGAYSLRDLMQDPEGPRNWKVKTAKATPYRGYREWNFNLEPHLRQKLAMDLFAAAGVPALPSRHVAFYVNGVRSGTYLEFPDPDNKPWLEATWGSSEGDLYKAATDIPGHPAFFGELTNLGPDDADYQHHYQKKTNNSGADSSDHSALRRWIEWIDSSSDAEFERGLPERFEVHAFLRYLVVANFAGHWDGYPNRGKNYWLHRDAANGRWSIVPWDLDATFETGRNCLNNMGVSAGLFFMNWPRTYCPNKLETKSRPLFERMMMVESWRRMYLGEYQKALTGYLEESALRRRVDSLEGVVEGALVEAEIASFARSQSEIRDYLARRSATIRTLLSEFPTYDPTPVGIDRKASVHRVANGPWMNLRGRSVSEAELRRAPPGIYWRGSERRIVF